MRCRAALFLGSFKRRPQQSQEIGPSVRQFARLDQGFQPGLGKDENTPPPGLARLLVVFLDATEILFSAFPTAQRRALEAYAANVGMKVVKTMTEGLTYLCVGRRLLRHFLRRCLKWIV